MKTDDLVTLLSTNSEPIDRYSVARTLFVALAAGIAVALGIALLGLWVRSDLTTTRALIFLALKLAFAIGIVGLALVYLARLARPAGNEGYRTSSSPCHVSSSCFLQPSALGPRSARIGAGRSWEMISWNAFSLSRLLRSFPSRFRSGPYGKVRHSE